MYGIALSVAACLRAGTKVDVAWIVASDDFPDRDATDAIAITPGGGRVGSLLSGAITDVPLGPARLVDVTVTDVDALVAGLTHGGVARCLVVPAHRPAGGALAEAARTASRSVSSPISTAASSRAPSC